MKKLTPFHLAIPVDNIPECREFYRDILGCEEGRSGIQWRQDDQLWKNDYY